MDILAMAEVTIYGAGIFGLSIGWACARRGAAVQIYDLNGVAAGSSGMQKKRFSSTA
jgi:glycine oxidase